MERYTNLHRDHIDTVVFEDLLFNLIEDDHMLMLVANPALIGLDPTAFPIEVPEAAFRLETPHEH